MPEMKTVESSNVHSVGYNVETLELDVRFKSKDGIPAAKIYRHKEVPHEIGNALMAADSVGGMYAKTIRGKYNTTSFDVA